MFVKEKIKIAIVGDVHEQWEIADDQALLSLGVDLVLFVGDFGNESLPIVRAIADLAIPKACVFGNHDAWFTATDWGRKKCPYDRQKEDRVQEQMNILADSHVGYGNKEFSQFALSVVGSRPFTWGGPQWKYDDFFASRFGVTGFQDSTQLILNSVKNTALDTIIFLGHNGPNGLGDRPESICGRDWQPLGGDFGDPDLGEAIAQSRLLGKRIPLVAFGHMHHKLRHTKKQMRESVLVDEYGTVYVNAANVPRIVEKDGVKLRNFSLVCLEKQVVSKVTLVWLGADQQIVSQTSLYESSVVV
jgi:uncharacterized protein (TIGR04168 family)